jgi:hypothetical protein
VRAHNRAREYQPARLAEKENCGGVPILQAITLI